MSREFVSSSANSVADPPPANVALRCRPWLCAKLSHGLQRSAAFAGGGIGDAVRQARRFSNWPRPVRHACRGVGRVTLGCVSHSGRAQFPPARQRSGSDQESRARVVCSEQGSALVGYSSRTAVNPSMTKRIDYRLGIRLRSYVGCTPILVPPWAKRATRTASLFCRFVSLPGRRGRRWPLSQSGLGQPSSPRARQPRFSPRLLGAEPPHTNLLISMGLSNESGRCFGLKQLRLLAFPILLLFLRSSLPAIRCLPTKSRSLAAARVETVLMVAGVHGKGTSSSSRPRSSKG